MPFPVSPNPGDSYTDAYGTVWIYAGSVNGWYRQQVSTPNDTSYTSAISGPAGSNTQVQFNDNGKLAGDSDLTWNKTSNVLGVTGDVNLSDGGTYTTTLQTITPTANRTVSIPDATGTLALVAGSSGQPVYNNAGAYAGLSTATIGATGNITLSLNGASGVAPVAITGTWFAGTTPQVLIQPSNVGTTGSWSPSGTGIGVNAASGFAGRLLDLQINGTSLYRFDSIYGLQVPTTGVLSAGLIPIAQWSSSLGFNVTSLRFDIANQDVVLTRDAAGTLAQRNGTSAQVFRVYNTYTSSTNYELGKLEWSGNTFRIGTEKGSGGGTARALDLRTNDQSRIEILETGGANYHKASEHRFYSNNSGAYTGLVARFDATSLRFEDGINISLASTTGTKIGTATTQKLGFYNATPVAQPAAVADATDAATAITQLNALLARMRDLGLIAT